MTGSQAEVVKAIPYDTAFVVNPAGGGGQAGKIWENIAALLEKRGQKYRVYFTSKPGHGSRLASRAAEEGAELIVAVGGDGTINEVVNGIDFERNIVGIIPAGTGNGFRKACKITGNWQGALDGLALWQPRSIDIGCADGHYFVNVAGIGFDAAVEQLAAGKYGNLKGYLAYLPAFFEELAAFNQFKTAVTINGRKIEQANTVLIILANGTHYGLNMCIAPDAFIDDGKLDFLMLHSTGPAGTFALAAQALIHKPKSHKFFAAEKVSRVYIESEDAVPVHLDGEVTGSLPIEIALVPAALRLLCP